MGQPRAAFQRVPINPTNVAFSITKWHKRCGGSRAECRALEHQPADQNGATDPHQVEQGGYASNSEVIRKAMRASQEQELQRAEHYEAIRAKITEADADPRPSLTEEEVNRHFKARLKKSLMARGEHD
jgi:antitoxin ParD1/3/4